MKRNNSARNHIDGSIMSQLYPRDVATQLNEEKKKRKEKERSCATGCEILSATARRISDYVTTEAIGQNRRFDASRPEILFSTFPSMLITIIADSLEFRNRRFFLNRAINWTFPRTSRRSSTSFERRAPSTCLSLSQSETTTGRGVKPAWHTCPEAP